MCANVRACKRPQSTFSDSKRRRGKGNAYKVWMWKSSGRTPRHAGVTSSKHARSHTTLHPQHHDDPHFSPRDKLGGKILVDV